jgi:hypothetical protein
MPAHMPHRTQFARTCHVIQDRLVEHKRSVLAGPQQRHHALSVGVRLPAVCKGARHHKPVAVYCTHVLSGERGLERRGGVAIGSRLFVRTQP